MNQMTLCSRVRCRIWLLYLLESWVMPV